MAEAMVPGERAGRLPGWAAVLIHVMFFFSGAAALVYEVVWMRMLSFVFGNTTYAVSAVLAVFLGGLAIGAFIYGRLADRRADLLRVYGRLEAGAALIALALPLLLLKALTPVYTWIYQRAGESVVALTAARFVLSGAALLAPAILLGGTLPVLVRFLVRQGKGMESHIGRLYGLNTLGAVVGSFAAGFALMPYLGMRWSNAAGAAIGLCVAVTAFMVHRALGESALSVPARFDGGALQNSAQSRPAEDDWVGAAALPPAVRRWLIGAFALSGFAALAYEVLWTRLLLFFFDSLVYAFSAMLCVYLLGLAVGSLIYSAWLSRSSRPAHWFVALEVMTGLSAAGTIPLFMILHGLKTQHMLGSFGGRMEWVFLSTGVIMIVPTVMIGAVFPLVCGMWARATGRVGAGVGEVYLVNTVGTVAGSLCAGFLLIPALGTRLAVFAMAGSNILAGLAVWAASGPRRASAGRWLAAAAAPAALVLLMNRQFTAQHLMSVYRHKDPVSIEWLREGIDGTVAIERGLGEAGALFGLGVDRRLSINGVNVAGTRIDYHTTQKLQAHLGLLIRPGAERVLQIGFGSGGTAYSASLHPVKRIDCVEISAVVIQAADRFEETNHGVLRDPRVRLYIEDARSFVRHTRHQYDVILSDSTHPYLAGEGLLYSVDYLRDCAARLKPGGIFSTWLPFYNMRPEDVKVMVRSIRAAFPYVYIWHTSIGRNEWCIVHGMSEPLAVDYRAFAGEVTIPAVQGDLRQIALGAPESILGLLLYDHRAVDRWLGEGRQLNTDDNGYLEFTAGREAFSWPAGRRMLAYFTLPEIVLNAGGSALDCLRGPGGHQPPWWERVRREIAANRHVLNARLYELPLEDRYDLRALTEYRRALQVVPGHFVASTMLGITDQQLGAARRAAAVPETSLLGMDQLAAAYTQLGRLDEAARWAEAMSRNVPREPGPEVVVALIQGRLDTAAHLIAQPPPDGQEAASMGMPRSELEQVIAAERAAVGTQEGERWASVGDGYRKLATAIQRNTRAPVGTSANLRVRNFRLHAIAGLLELSRRRYEIALGLSPSDPSARLGLAQVEAALGEDERAIWLLKGPLPDARAQRAGAELLAAAEEDQRNPFGFIAVLQHRASARIRDRGR